MSVPIRLILLNEFSLYREKIIKGLEQAGLYPEWFQPENKADFLKTVAEKHPDVIVIAVGISKGRPLFQFRQVQGWLLEQNDKLPFWMILKPEDEPIAVSAMYVGLTDYFYTDRLSRMAPAAAKLVRRTKQTLEPVALNPLLEGILEGYRPRFEARNLELTFLPGVDLPPFLGESWSLTQATSSIMENILEAAPTGTKSDARSYLDAVKGEVCLEIKLSGEGLW
ncbi:MAG: hypothetical protein WAM60_08890, partial [Candidatus Promineifilaceae bacterium]